MSNSINCRSLEGKTVEQAYQIGKEDGNAEIQEASNAAEKFIDKEFICSAIDELSEGTLEVELDWKKGDGEGLSFDEYKRERHICISYEIATKIGEFLSSLLQ